MMLLRNVMRIVFKSTWAHDVLAERNVTEFCRRNTVIRAHMEPQRNVTCSSVAYTTVCIFVMTLDLYRIKVSQECLISF